MRTLTVNQMASMNAGEYTATNAACDVAMAVAGGIWTAAVGIATGGVGGFIFGVAWAPFQGWVCSHA